MRRPNRLEVRKLHQDRRHEHAQRPIGKILAFIRNMDQVCPTFKARSHGAMCDCDLLYQEMECCLRFSDFVHKVRWVWM